MTGHSKYARCSIVVIKVFNEMMQEIIGKSPVHADQIYQIIMSTKKFKERLKHSEMKNIQTLQTEGFSKLDISLIYKIGKFFNFIPPPTRHWGATPLFNEIDIGDDVERIRIARNKMVHRIDCEMSEEEMSAFFSEFIAVGERIDVYLNKQNDAGFRDKMKWYQTCPLGSEIEEYSKTLQEIESLKEQFQVSVENKVIHIFYGNSMKELIEGIRQEEESSSSAVIFVVKGVEDSENKAELLNSLSDQINSGFVKIHFKEARKGSIILYTDIKNSILQNSRSFVDELTAFMERVFTLVDLKLTTDDTCNVIVIPNEDDEQTLTDEKSYDKTEKTDLVLELNVSNEIFQTDESIQQHFGCFVDKISRMTNGKDVLTRSDRIAVLYADENGREINENKAGNENQDKDGGKKSKESCENKSQYQPTEENVSDMVQAQSPKIELSDTDGKNGEDVLKEKNSKEITDKKIKDRPEMPYIIENAEKQIVKTSMLTNEEIETAGKILADKRSSLEGLIKNLGLDNFFPDKINLMDVMVVKNPIKSVTYTDVPWIVLRSLVMGNFNARDKMLQEFLEKAQETKPIAKLVTSVSFDNFFDSLLDEDDNNMSLNPMDLLVVLFYCSSPIFKQILAQKLFLCKLAIPIFLPSLTSETVSFCTWILQTIVIACKTESKGSLQSEITKCPCHTVGFIRLGKISVSKSKVINDILTDQYHNTFFNKDCPLGTSVRTVSDGTIEGAWILPSNHSDFLNDVVMCLNLRGDGQTHRYQIEIISRVSSVVVVMVDVTLLQHEATRNVLLNFHKSSNGLVIAIDANSVDMTKIRDICKDFSSQLGHFTTQTAFCFLSREGKATSFSDIKMSIRRCIANLTANLKPLTLSERLKSEGFTNSEVECEFKECKEKAEDILRCMPIMDSNIKDEIVPLQGKTWRTWTKYCKSLHKSTQYTSLHEADTIRQNMIEMRSKQLDICKNVGQFMKSFIEVIVQYRNHDLHFTFFIWWLKILLDDRSRLVLPKYLAKYQQDWQALRSVKNKKQNDVMEALRKQLNNSEYDLAEASFGLEHLIRELGQMYEAMIECKWKSPCNLPLATNLASVGAKMILNGQPFELMDGDAANVPLIWTKAVLDELKQMIGDKKLLALSVLGVQSSGKSTLLNTMFGLQFVVSAGRCTRGVFMQLVKVEKSSVPVDYIVVIDAEGLRAPELAHQKYSHDNELATFVIGLGDITIINIKGENTAEVQDVLQIAVHAFLRLKLANSRLNLKQSCIFIHQNVPASDANDKMMQGRQKFLETLDRMTQEAADQENIADIHSFSQVIDFDCNKDVWYLSDLWNGDPPMAPINPGYTRRVDEVGNTILYELASVRETYLTITDTITRIDDLWKGILKDDFVYSFRNSLELKAYNNMEQKFQELSWQLEKFVTEFVLSEAKGEFMYCSNEEDLTKAIPKILKLCSNNVYKQVNVLINELENFVESSSLKDVMIQWKQNKENRLRMMCEDLIDRSKASILKTKEEILIEKLRMNAQKNHEMEINERAQQLATEMRGAKPSTDVLKHKFDNMWDNWMTKFNTETSEDCISIKDQIESLIWEKFRSDAAFLECQTDDCESDKSQSQMHIDEYRPIKDDVKFNLSRVYGSEIASDIIHMSDDEFQIFHNLIQLEGSIGIIDIADCHIQIKRSWFGFGKEKEDKFTCKQQTLSSTNELLHKIDMFFVDIKDMNVEFNAKFAKEIIKIIQHHIESQNRHLMSMFCFVLTTSYEVMVTKHIIRYALLWFTHLNVKHRKRQISQSAPNTALGNPPSPGNAIPCTHRNMKRNKEQTKLEGSIHNSDILTNHLSMIKSSDGKNWNTYMELRNKAVEVTNTMLKKIDTRLAEYNSQDVRFDISFATEIMLLISKEIDIHNKHLENSHRFNLLSPYRAMVVTHVQPFITDFFVNLKDKYNKKHSPKGQMEEYKGTVWTLFKNVVDSKTENVIAATFFKEAIVKAVTEHMGDILPILVQEHIMKSFAHEKYTLLKTIMIDLAEKDIFEFFFIFILDPSEYTRAWMQRYIDNEMFDHGVDNCTTYGMLAKCQIKKILKLLLESISEASRICCNTDMKDISSWIQAFIQHSRELNILPFPNEVFVHVQNRTVDDLESYTNDIINDWNEMESDIFKLYDDTDKNTVQWKKNPIAEIMEKLWGCTAKCMFCAEPCRHTDKSHAEQNISHQCIQHRPQGIGGFHWEDTRYLVTEFCNFWVQTNQKYKWGPEKQQECRYYKEYKTHFPEWDIVPSSDKSKYWMWVMNKYQNELKERYEVEKPKLPATWKIITKEEAIESLSFV